MNSDLNERLVKYQRIYYASNKIKKIKKYFFASYKMSEQALKFGNIVVNKKEFHASEKPIALNLINTNKIVISDKIKQ